MVLLAVRGNGQRAIKMRFTESEIALDRHAVADASIMRRTHTTYLVSAGGTRAPGGGGARWTGRRSRAELSRAHRPRACRPGRDAGGVGRRGRSACARR